MIVKLCTCKHDFQDRAYGRGRRVHNATSGVGGKKIVHRCTVCGDEKDGPEPKRMEKETEEK